MEPSETKALIAEVIAAYPTHGWDVEGTVAIWEKQISDVGDYGRAREALNLMIRQESFPSISKLLVRYEQLSSTVKYQELPDPPAPEINPSRKAHAMAIVADQERMIADRTEPKHSDHDAESWRLCVVCRERWGVAGRRTRGPNQSNGRRQR